MTPRLNPFATASAPSTVYTVAHREAASSRSITLSYGIVIFFLLAANLRPALTSVGPLLEPIRSSLGLSDAAAGLLQTLPLLILAGFSPFARLGDFIGIERTLAGCLALIAAGIALRSTGSAAALFGGTVVFAIGIAVANVLVPSVIKRDFPHQVGTMTTAYIMVMSFTGAAATGLAVPLSHHLAGGWKGSLAIWAAFAAACLLCWLPAARKANVKVNAQGNISIAAQRQGEEATTRPIWRSSVAWLVTVFMGLQFLIYYVILSWVPLFLADNGKSASEAGWLLTLYQMMSFAVGIVAPTLLRRGRDQRVIAVAGSLVTALSILGLLVAPRFATLWLLVCGVSFGMTFILAFALIGMRTSDHRRAAALSTMAQATAYLIAASGPVAFGWLHDLTSSWTLPMAAVVAAAMVQAVVGYGAGQERKV